MEKYIGKLLKKHNIKDIVLGGIIWHLNIEDVPIQKILDVCEINSDLSEQEIAIELANIIRSCSSTSLNYNPEIYKKLMNLGNEYFIVRGTYNHNLWDNSMFEDDDFGFSNKNTDYYDDVLDNVNDSDYRSMR